MMARARARNLADADIAEIVAILDGWTGKLSWELLIQAVRQRKHATYTRQALHKHERIKLAFSVCKSRLAATDPGSVIKVGSPELQAALERIKRLEGENARLMAENQALLGQFACWAYNAGTRGLDHAFLSRPLPQVDRDRTPRASVTTKHRSV